MTFVPVENQPVLAPITVTADTVPVQIPFPEARYAEQFMELTVHESAGPVELISDPAQTKGLSLSQTAAEDLNLQAGSWRLRGLVLYVRAETPTTITFVPIVSP